MPADQPRNRTVGCKMSDSEYERLATVPVTEENRVVQAASGSH